MSGPEASHGDYSYLPLPRRGVLSGNFSAHEPPLAAVFVCALKAKSPGSSPGNATKIPNKIKGLKTKAKISSFVFRFGGTSAIVVSGID
jgi:hypothetical protein